MYHLFNINMSLLPRFGLKSLKVPVTSLYKLNVNNGHQKNKIYMLDKDGGVGREICWHSCYEYALVRAIF